MEQSKKNIVQIRGLKLGIRVVDEKIDNLRKMRKNKNAK